MLNPKTNKSMYLPSILGIFLIIIGLILAQPFKSDADEPSYDHTFTVDSTSWTADILKGDDICADASGDCSLRAAIDEASRNMGDSVLIQFSSGLSGTISLTSEPAEFQGQYIILGNLNATIDCTALPDGANNTAFPQTVHTDSENSSFSNIKTNECDIQFNSGASLVNSIMQGGNVNTGTDTKSFTISGNTLVGTGITFYEFSAPSTGSSNNTITENTITSCDGCILGDMSSNNTISNNTITPTNPGQAINLNVSGGGNNISGNIINGSSFLNYPDGYYPSLTFSNNTVNNASSHSISIDKIDGMFDNTTFANITIEDNTMDTAGGLGIYISDVEVASLDINNNNISNTTENCIGIDEPSTLNFSGNTLDSCGDDDGISISGDISVETFEDNTFSNNKTGLDIDNSEEGEVSGTISSNTFSNNETGFNIEGNTDDLIISNNTYSENNVAVKFFEAEGITISNETIENNGYGIFFENDTQNNRIENSTITNSTASDVHQQAEDNGTNYLYNTSFSTYDIDSSSVIASYMARINVKNQDGNNLNNAEVVLEDEDGNETDFGSTGTDGNTSYIDEITGATITATGLTSEQYTASVIYQGATRTQTVTFSQPDQTANFIFDFNASDDEEESDPASVSGYVYLNHEIKTSAQVHLYQDINENGSLDIGTDNLFSIKTTNSNGYYIFTQLDPNKYIVTVQPSTMGLTEGQYKRDSQYPNPRAIELTSGENKKQQNFFYLSGCFIDDFGSSDSINNYYRLREDRREFATYSIADGKILLDLHGPSTLLTEMGKDGINEWARTDYLGWVEYFRANTDYNFLQPRNRNFVRGNFLTEVNFSDLENYSTDGLKRFFKLRVSFKDNYKLTNVYVYRDQNRGTVFSYYMYGNSPEVSRKRIASMTSDSGRMAIERQDNSIIFYIDGEEEHRMDFDYLPEVGKVSVFMHALFTEQKIKVKIDDLRIENGCHRAYCGNGVLEFQEECDDGNRTSYDGCSRTCELEPTVNQCSNGKDDDHDFLCDYAGCTIDGVEYPADPSCSSGSDSDELNPRAICDNGNDEEPDLFTDYTSDPGCVNSQDTDEYNEWKRHDPYDPDDPDPDPDDPDPDPAECGNGTVEDGEECDDGNKTSYDGCSKTCIIENITINYNTNTTPAKNSNENTNSEVTENSNTNINTNLNISNLNVNLRLGNLNTNVDDNGNTIITQPSTEDLVLEGVTTPNTRVVITIVLEDGEEIQVETISDSEGNWKIIVDKDMLPEGDHIIYIQTEINGVLSDRVELAKLIISDEKKISTSSLFSLNNEP